MRKFYLFLLVVLCISCINEKDKRTILINKELEAIPIVSLTFDSLLQEVQMLSPQQQVQILLNISYRDEIDINAVEKQEDVLIKALSLAPKKGKKKVLQQLIDIYHKLDQLGNLDAASNALIRCGELQSQYTLSQEESWKVNKSRIFFLNQKGQYKDGFLILYNLLEEHRDAGKTKCVIEDLKIIATYFIRLRDFEKALSIYKEAYQLAVNEQLLNEQRACLTSIINTSFDLKLFNEIVNIYNAVNVDSIATHIPFTYSMLYLCYFQLQKPDSARVYLNKMRQKTHKESGIVFNCRMAEIYVLENCEDSATFYLNEAMKQLKVNSKSYSQKIEALPMYFMYVYPSYASLLQRNGKTQQAEEAFRFVEPLMKMPVNEPNRLEKQIDALDHYSSFCIATKQYEKAADLLLFKDSIQRKYYEDKENRDSINWGERFETQRLVYENKQQKTQIDNAKRITASTWAVCLILGTLCAIIGSIIFRKNRSLCQQIKELASQLAPPQPAPLPKSEPLSPEEKLYNRACSLVKSKKLFRDSELTLDKLAKKLASNRSSLSAAINKCAKLNFNQWINKFRLDYVMENISPTVNFSMLYKEAGFNAYNTFNSCFKERMKCTPTEFLKTDEFKKLQESRSAT